MMKKILTLLCTMLFAIQFMAAQNSLYVISKSGELTVFPTNKVTFDNLFTFKFKDGTEVTNNMIAGSFSVAFKTDTYKSLIGAPEVGICFSDINEKPTISDMRVIENSALGEMTFNLNELDAGTTYYYRAYVKIGIVVYYGEVQNSTTSGTKPEYKIIDGHKFVDLGLPSGLLWATCNIGAVYAADSGSIFAWGETDPNYSGTYKFRADDNMTKYNSTDGKIVLDKEDDAAFVNWGSSCRMPTRANFDELMDSNNCSWTYTSMASSSGISQKGYKVTSIKNGNSIFIPEEQYFEWGRYWTSTLYSKNNYQAYILRIHDNNEDFFFSTLPRDSRKPVRAVAESN